MATDSSMKDISRVETYSKSLMQVSQQVEQVFDKLKKQTDIIGQNWSDSQFNEFRAQFNESIIKKIKGTCATLQRLSEYTKKQCEFHRMAQQHKL
jgi:uncharacterized protein YukE